MASSSENNILETIDVLPVKEFPQMFVQSIVAIFEYSKDEIIDWLKTKSFLSLMSLRDLVLAELVKKLPQFVGRNTYHRRKAELLAKDIYIFGFSTVSGLADKRLYSECFKPTADENTSQISMDQDAEDSNEVENNSVNTSHRNIDTILDMCVQLKDRVKKLETTVKLQAPYKGHHRTRQSVIHHQKPQPKEDVRRSQNYVRSYRHDARQRNVHFDYNHGVAWQSPRFTNNGRRY